jgi:hypothetical protein
VAQRIDPCQRSCSYRATRNQRGLHAYQLTGWRSLGTPNILRIANVGKDGATGNWLFSPLFSRLTLTIHFRFDTNLAEAAGRAIAPC